LKAVALLLFSCQLFNVTLGQTLKFNYDLLLENVYYFNPPERSLWGDLQIIEKKEKSMFYILQWFPENKIHVFSNETFSE